MQKHRPDRLTAPDEPARTARATASTGGPNRYNLAARAARWLEWMPHLAGEPKPREEIAREDAPQTPPVPVA